MELDIEKFNPTKADIALLVKKADGLTINGIDDKAGYEAVHQARMGLKNARVEITKQGKSLRDGAVKFQKEVIRVEKELIALIEPTETELENKQSMIDEEKESLKRVKLLPERRDKLYEINEEVEDAFLLTMDDRQFQEFFNQKKEIYLIVKQEKMDKEKRELEAQQLKLEQDKAIEEARKQAEKEAQKKAIRDAELAKINAEQDKINAVNEAKLQAEKEKQAIIDEQANKEKERIASEEKIKKESEEKARLEKEAQAKLEKQKKYQKFLTDNNYNQDLDLLDVKENKVIIWRKVAEFIK